MLKKKIMVNPLLDQAGIGPQSAQAITDQLLDLLAASDHLIVSKAPPDKDLQLDPKSLGFGIVISPKLIQRAKAMGMSGLITGVINPVEITEKTKGIWPFKKVVKNFEGSLYLNLLDTASETLLLTKVLSKNISVSIEEAGNVEAHELKIRALEKIFPKLIKDFAEEVEYTLAKEPWIGQVLSVGQYVVINAGKDVGVRRGHRFAVLVPGQKVASLDKRKFPIYWKKIGEVEVVKVEENQALAKPIKGKGFAPGQLIEFID